MASLSAEEPMNRDESVIASIISNTVLVTQVISLTICKIVKNFIPNKYENSNKMYRLPHYQRDSQPNEEWSQELVFSVIYGLSIGSIHTSEHIIDGSKRGKYYNIEDGRTRITALHNFYNNKFSIKIDQTEYFYKNLPEDIQDKFKEYPISCVQLEPINGDIEPKVYNRALADNFIKLQDGVPLGPHDHYWAWVENQESELDGSPLVNYAVNMVNDHELSDLIKWIGAKKMNQRGDKERKPITKIVSLVASVWKGNDENDYAKEDFNGKRSIITENITEHEKSLIKKKLLIIQDIIQQSIDEKNYPKEQFGDFMKNKFTATIIEDLNDEGISDDNKNKWVSLITELRKEKQKAILENKRNKYEWLETEVYSGLSKGAKQGNCNLSQIKERAEAINKWWETKNTE
tara:strand:+ start:118 stop:1329 length:1212 start_codon:yes stop_codon:yes gene_type:complete